jgi:hypothetical protein
MFGARLVDILTPTCEHARTHARTHGANPETGIVWWVRGRTEDTYISGVVVIMVVVVQGGVEGGGRLESNQTNTGHASQTVPPGSTLPSRPLPVPGSITVHGMVQYYIHPYVEAMSGGRWPVTAIVHVHTVCIPHVTVLYLKHTSSGQVYCRRRPGYKDDALESHLISSHHITSQRIASHRAHAGAVRICIYYMYTHLVHVPARTPYRHLHLH